MGWLFDAVAQEGDPSVTLPPAPDAHGLCDVGAARAILEPIGFECVETHDIASQLFIRRPEGLFDAFHRGSVRAASLLTHQPPANRCAINAELAALALKYGVARDGGLVVPMPSVAVVARKSG